MHLHLPVAATMFSEESGADGRSTTYWKSDTVRSCFWQLERRKFKPCSETNEEVTPTDVYIRSRSVPRAICLPSCTLLRVHEYILQRGYLTLLVLTRRLPTAKAAERAGVDTPFFHMWYENRCYEPIFGIWVSAGKTNDNG